MKNGEEYEILKRRDMHKDALARAERKMNNTAIKIAQARIEELERVLSLNE